MKHKSLWIVLGITLAVLAPLTTFNLLDTFYYTHTEGKFIFNDEDLHDWDGEETTVKYENGTYNIKGYEATYHLLDIHVSSLSLFKSWLATDSEDNYGININQSLNDIIQTVKDKTGRSVLGAITGDYCFWSSSRSGYVVRNSVVYRRDMKSPNSVDLVVKKDGSISLMKEKDYAPDVGIGRVSKKYYQVVSFGPALMENSEILIEENAEINGNTWVNNPRAAFGWVDSHHFMFLATEAKDRTSKNLKSFRLYDLATFLKEKGCIGAYNFDGGYSAGLAFNDQVVFSPKRGIGDIFFIMS